MQSRGRRGDKGSELAKRLRGELTLLVVRGKAVHSASEATATARHSEVALSAARTFASSACSAAALAFHSSISSAHPPVYTPSVHNDGGSVATHTKKHTRMQKHVIETELIQCSHANIEGKR